MSFSQLNDKTNYWLVRTKGGQFYDQFVAENYIAVGWNKVSDLGEIRAAGQDTACREALKRAIADMVNDDGDPVDKKPGHTLNQIIRFVNEMAVGDIVLIPSASSHLIEYGIIESDAYLDDRRFFSVEEGECDFVKRRKVKWIRRDKRASLDPYLYRLLNSQHTITSANEYAHYIDRTLHKLFIKGDRAHFIIEVAKQKDIYGLDIAMLISEVAAAMELCNEVAGTSFDPRVELNTRANIQSPGFFEFFGAIDAMLGTVFAICALMGIKFKFGILEVDSPGVLGLVEKWYAVKEKGLDLKLKEQKIRRALENLEAKLPAELSSECPENDGAPE